MPEQFADIGLIILAAGSSSRLGRAKQLLPYKDTTLIGHAVETALSCGCDPLVVVTGAVHDAVVAQVDTKSVKIIHNARWVEGMASSIKCGITAIEQNQTRKISGILIMLCDQPMITAQHLRTLCETFVGTGCESAIATGYADTTGVPAVFPPAMFEQLNNLKGQQGARQLLNQNNKTVTLIPFDDAVIDVDTPEDYERLMGI